MNNPQTEPVQMLDQQKIKLDSLTQTVSSSASYFYAIAGFSLVNSLLYVFNAGVYFLIGLGISTFVDAFMQGVGIGLPEYALALKIVGVVINVAIAGIFALLGFIAKKHHLGAFILGMGVYALDALLLLVLTDWLSFAFHLFFLFRLYSGFSAIRQIQKLKQELPASEKPLITKA